MIRLRHLAGATAVLLVAACAETPTTAPGAARPNLAAASGKGNENGNKFQCFSGTTDGGYNGTCAYTASGDGAVLNTVDNDADPNNAYAGVYLQNTNLDGKLLAEVNKLSFSYSGTGASGGSPRFSIPIDANNDGATDAYAFIDTQGCNDGSPNTGTLDAINDATCTVWYANVSYANWAAFATANPTYRIAKGALPFIIVDQPGTFTVTDIQIGKGPAKAAK